MSVYKGVFVFLVIKALYFVQGSCPDGFEPHASSCYKALNLEASWAEAQMYCQLLGSDLAVIDSATEETLVEGMIIRLHGHVDDTYWIAGTDIATEGTWRWMSKTGVISLISGYSNWPSSVAPSDNRNHNCLAINYRHGKGTWTDEYCSNPHSFVCEAALSDPVTTTTTKSAVITEISTSPTTDSVL